MKMPKARGRRDAAKQGWKTRKERLSDGNCGVSNSKKKRKLWDERAMIEGYDTFINHVRSNRNHLINPQKSEITYQKSL